jgi:hypothetical protein
MNAKPPEAAFSHGTDVVGKVLVARLGRLYPA